LIASSNDHGSEALSSGVSLWTNCWTEYDLRVHALDAALARARAGVASAVG
jgi:hypothetical protein